MPHADLHRQLCRSAGPLTIAAAGVVLALPSPAAADLLPPAGPWPVAVPSAPNPLAGTPFPVNGANATANARLSAYLPVGRRGRRTTLTRVIGGRTVIRGTLRNADIHKRIRGAVLLLVAQNVYTGAWSKVANVRTGRTGRYRAVLPAGLTRRAALLYWPAAASPTPVASRRVTVKTSARVRLSARRRGSLVRFIGKVSGWPMPPGGLRVQVQVRNSDGWVTLRLPRTTPTGRFRASYRFRNGRRYRVRAVVPAQAGWPLYRGASRARTIRPR